MSLLALCRDTASFTRKTVAAGAGGAHAETFTPLYTDIRVTIQPANGKIVERFSRMSMEISHVCYTPTRIVLRAGDECTAADGRVFNVVFYEDQAARMTVYAAYLLQKD